ncbi:hypothetical protein WJX72_003377 [[Myrmecia] bisecta]|uniref:Uncharacterized protein n=1 Tax=[Myrmecia] bisecta TaxID=41462 RepID=A0AAW1P4N8_9CHLO
MLVKLLISLTLLGGAFGQKNSTGGLVVLNDSFYLTTVNVINRANGTGEGYVLRYSFNGTLLDRVQIGGRAQLPAYHAGGLDTDGTYLYVPLAEYHSGAACGAVPNCTLPGTSYIYLVTPDLKEVKLLFTAPDHVGGLTLSGCDTNVIDGNTWGSRTFYRWSLPDGKLLGKVKNQNYMFEYQDCKALTSCSVQVCSGIKNFQYQRRRDGLVGDQTVSVVGNSTGNIAFQSGGLALVDPVTGIAITQVPVPAILTPLGNGLTINPMWVTNSFNGTTGFRFLFAPDDVKGSVVVVKPRTP